MELNNNGLTITSCIARAIASILAKELSRMFMNMLMLSVSTCNRSCSAFNHACFFSKVIFASNFNLASSSASFCNLSIVKKPNKTPHINSLIKNYNSSQFVPQNNHSLSITSMFVYASKAMMENGGSNTQFIINTKSKSLVHKVKTHYTLFQSSINFNKLSYITSTPINPSITHHSSIFLLCMWLILLVNIMQ